MSSAQNFIPRTLARISPMQTEQLFLVSLVVATVLAMIFYPAHAQPQITQGDIYRDVKDGDSMVIVSPKEIELQNKEGNFIGEYFVQNNRIRVVLTTLGTKHALYFDITEDGLKYQK